MTDSIDHGESKTERGNERVSNVARNPSAAGERSVSPHALYCISAAAPVLAGLSLAIGEFVHPEPPFADSVATTEWAVSHVLWWLGALAAALGFAGLYVRQREAVGLFGFAGSAFAVVGSTLIACAMFFEAFVAPTVAAEAPELFDSYPAGGGWEGFLAGVLAAGALVGGGLALFGIALYRAGTVPRWAIVLTVLGGVPFAVNSLLPHAVAVAAAAAFGVAWRDWASRSGGTAIGRSPALRRARSRWSDLRRPGRRSTVRTSSQAAQLRSPPIQFHLR